MKKKTTNTIEISRKQITNDDFEKFERKWGNYYFSVVNPHAVCSSDTFVYHVEVDKIKESDYTLKLLAEGASFYIAERIERTNGNPCYGPSYFYEKIEKATEEAKKFDYEEIYDNCCEKDVER